MDDDAMLIDRRNRSTEKLSSPDSAESRIRAKGEMAERIRAFPWETTGLGPIGGWPEVLAWSINLMLESRFPTTILWGTEMLQFYNDAYMPLTAEKHPSLLGQPAPEQWVEAWHIIGPQFRSVLERGETIYQEDVLVPVVRGGRVQDVYWTYSYSPIRGAEGGIEGILIVCHDVTAKLAIERERDSIATNLRNVLGSISDGLAVLDQHWCYTYVNEQGAGMLSIKPEELIGRCVWDLFPRAAESEFGKGYLRAVETGRPVHFEAFYPEPLNAWIECHCYPSSRGLSVYFRNITEQKSAEEALGVSEGRFRKLFESDMLGIGIPDRFGAFRDGNNELLRMTGYTREDLEAGLVRWDTMTPPEYRGLDVAHIREAAERGSCTPYEKEYIRKDGTRVPILCGYALLEGSEDEYVGFVMDLTAQKMANEERFAVTQQLQALMKALPVGVSFSDDATCKRITGNPAVLAQFEVKAQDNLSASADAADAPGRAVRFFKDGRLITADELPLQRAVRENREISSMELEVELPSGRRWTADCCGAPVRDAKGNVIAGVAVTTDVTERRQAEQRLRESEERFRLLADSVPQLVWISNHKGETIYCNLRFRDYFGRNDAEFTGFGWAGVVHPEDLGRTMETWLGCMESAEPFLMNYRLLRGDGSYRHFLAQALPLKDEAGGVERWIGSAMDIHDQKLAEEALRRTEKLATAGRLAASIAHEINNPLESVTNSLYLALQDDSLSADSRMYLKMAEQELARVAHITTQTLRFHKQSNAAAKTDLCEVMRSVLALFRPRLMTKQIAVIEECNAEARIDCFADEVRQVFANLISNALDATPAAGRVRIRIRQTRSLNGDGEDGVKVVVADTGMGIPASVMGRIFEPFVSTKEATGIGLGLWVSEGIVRKHHGRIRVRSRTDGANHGTVISVFFPAAAR